jgi:PAS domain S-box-containing protein
MRAIRADGEIRHCLARGHAKMGPEGKVTRLFGSLQDITDRKRAEDALQERATQLALLNEIGGQVAALLDMDQVLDRAAHLVQERLGYHHVGLFTRDAGEERLVMRARAGEFAPLFPPDHSLALGQGLVGWVGQHGETLLANDVDAEPHYVNPYPDRLPTRSELSVPIRIGDEIVGVLDLQSPQPNAFDPDDVATLETLAGQLAVAMNNARLYQAIQQELGERLRAEAELRRLNEFNESIVQSMTEGIIVEDAAGSLTFVNPAAAAMLGYAPGELIGQHWTSIVAPDQQPLVQVADARRAQGQTDRYEVDLVRRDGGRFPVLVSASPRLAPEDGRFSGTLAVFTDLSELKRLEDQFRQAQKMEAVGRLAGGVAHDFNNLLTVIHLSTRLLERKLRPEDSLRSTASEAVWPHVQRIQEASRRAANLTKQLLAFSRKEIMEPKVLDLNDLLSELDKMLRRLIREDIELTTRLAADLWPVKIDPTQVEQVVVNLAVNARDAMPSGGRLTLETADVTLDAAYAAHHLEAQPGEYVLLTVSDTGVGISEEVKAHLFEPFFTTKERGKGTGLGLATVFGIVKQNGGHIEVFGEVGQGTTFKIYLPRVSEGVPAPAPPVSQPAARGSETLLLVEDEPLLQEIVCDTLQGQGYQVLTAHDGLEGLRVAEAHEGPIHLLLTDVVMPRLSGRALADQLQTSHPAMRVLFTSGYTDNAIVHHGVLAEGVHFLSKPFDLEALAKKVRDVLDAAERPAAEGEQEETP